MVQALWKSSTVMMQKPELYVLKKPYHNKVGIMDSGSLSSLILVLYLSLDPSTALYNADTDRGVYVLTDETYNHTVFRNPGPATESLTWIIQFYNSWCGHCIKFAPLYKAVANKTQHWSDYVRLGTVDCSYELNRPLCSRLRITATPAIRVFSPGSPVTSQGDDTETSKKAMDLLYHMLDILEFNAHPRDLLPLPEVSVESLWNTLPHEVSALAVIIEPIGSYVGKEVVMHLLPNLQRIHVRRAFSSNRALLQSLNVVAQAPLILFLERNLGGQRGVVTLEKLGEPDPVKAFATAVLRADAELIRRQNLVRQPLRGPNYGELRPEPNIQRDYVPAPARPLVLKSSMQDVNSAVIYAVSSEAGRREELSGSEFEALRKFIRVVLRLIPARADIIMALRQLETSMLRRASVGGSEILQILQESGLDFHDSRIEWDNCKGSIPDRRGYPCGLWTLFHKLTVRAYEDSLASHSEANALGPDGVLTAIVSYIENLFTCGECSENFMKKVKNLRQQVTFIDNANSVLFLWRAHNDANRMLAGDYSEDPGYPKVQFPSRAQCPLCRKTEDPAAASVIWDDRQVLRFLQTFYGNHGNRQ